MKSQEQKMILENWTQKVAKKNNFIRPHVESRSSLKQKKTSDPFQVELLAMIQELLDSLRTLVVHQSFQEERPIFDDQHQTKLELIYNRIKQLTSTMFLATELSSWKQFIHQVEQLEWVDSSLLHSHEIIPKIDHLICWIEQMKQGLMGPDFVSD